MQVFTNKPAEKNLRSLYLGLTFGLQWNIASVVWLYTYMAAKCYCTLNLTR